MSAAERLRAYLGRNDILWHAPYDSTLNDILPHYQPDERKEIIRLALDAGYSPETTLRELAEGLEPMPMDDEP